MNLPSGLILRFYELAERTIKELKNEASDTILHYVGNLDEPFSNALTSRLERILSERISNKSIQKRFFNAFIEIVQNIRIHAIKDVDEHVHAGLIVYERNGKLCADFLNIVSRKQAEHLEARYKEINSLSAEELKKLYLDIMLHGEISLKGGAGLGIITVVMKTKNPSQVRTIEINRDYAIFGSHIELEGLE
jgi:formate dehydrogenase maturation protein FdhE